MINILNGLIWAFAIYGLVQLIKKIMQKIKDKKNEKE